MIIYVEHGAPVVASGCGKEHRPADADRAVRRESRTAALKRRKGVGSRKDDPGEDTEGRMPLAIRAAGQAGRSYRGDAAVRR